MDEELSRGMSGNPESPSVEPARPKAKKSGLRKAKEAAKTTKKVAVKATAKPNSKAPKVAKAAPPEPVPVEVEIPSSSAKAAKGPAVGTVAEMRRGAELLKQVSDGTRLTVMMLLRDGPLFVGEICEHVSQSQPAVSHHLALLRHGGMIEPIRDGKHNYYNLTEKGARLIAAVASAVGE